MGGLSTSLVTNRNMLVLLLSVFWHLSSCSEWFMDEPDYYMSSLLDGSLNDQQDIMYTPLRDDYEKLCIRTEYYFCPGVSGPLMRVEVVKDVCTDPPSVLSMSECKEYLECDPHHYIIGEKSCTTATGTPGYYTIYCVKGFVQEGMCKGTGDANTHNDVINHNLDDVITSEDEINECGPVEVGETCFKQDVDILFIIDMSASMIPEIQSVYNFVGTFSVENAGADHVKWALIVGPKNAGNKPGNHNFLYLASNIQPIKDFQDAMGDVLQYDMIGQYEMLYDALYLSIRNISSFLPYSGEELLWPVWVGNVIDESVPPLADFFVAWRENSKRVIVVFTDEPGQSFLIPESKVGKTYNTNDTITQDKLVLMLQSIDNIQLYAFTNITDKNTKNAWYPLATATGGTSIELNSAPDVTKDKLAEIFNKEVCY